MTEVSADNNGVMNKAYAVSECLKDMKSGEWINGFADGIGECLAKCEELCFEFNSMAPLRKEQRMAVLRKIFQALGENCTIHSPFHCDFGSNIRIGDNFVGNFNLTILDEADVTIGNNVFIGPNTSLCTVVHSLKPEERNRGIMCARPIVIGNNVWIAANVVILPGVTVGEGAVIGAGSVVTKDVAPFTLVVGNPARFIRNIEP